MTNEPLVQLTADIVAAHVANNHVAVGDIGSLVQQVHAALAALQSPTNEAPQEKVAVVSARASVKPDYIVCMECGAKQKMLKRHLATAHNMTPAEYRADYGLPAAYPMTAPNYSERRRSLAKSSGLGRKRAAPASGGGDEAGSAASPPKRRGRKPAAAAAAAAPSSAEAPAPKRRGRKPAAKPADAPEASAPKRRGRKPAADKSEQA